MADQNEIDQLFEEAYALFEQKQRVQPTISKDKLGTIDNGKSYSLTPHLKTISENGRNGKEIEVRFGWFEDTRFVPGVAKEYFYNLLNVFSGKMPEVKPVKTVTYIKDNLRVLVGDSVTAELKTVEQSFDDMEWGIRLSIAQETSKSVPKDYDQWFKRIKNRWSFEIGARRFDLTIVDNGKETVYEVEIEYDVMKDMNVYSDCSIVLHHMQKTHINQILLQTQIKQIIRNCNLLTVDPKKAKAPWVGNKFDSIENKPQSFNWNNVWNQSDIYFVTPKLDGLRRRIFFDNNGIFEVGPNSNYVRQIDNPISEQVGTIIDTEYYNGKYYPFDILSSNGVSLLNEPFKTRYLQYLVNVGYTKLFDYSKPFYFQKGFFGSIKSAQKWMLSNSSMKFDGFIAQSNEPIYSGIKTMKIKPLDELTVDLLTKIDEKGQVRLYSYNENGPVEENFNPKNINDMKSELGRYTVKNLKLSKKLDSGSIVEYRFVDKEPWLVYKGIRRDKITPNFHRIVNNVYKDFFVDPTSIDDLTDNTLLPWRKYASFIKRQQIDKFVSVGDRVLDIGIGRGGTLVETLKKASMVYGIDPNKDNISSLVERMDGDISRVQLSNIRGQDTKEVIKFIGSPVNVVLSMFSLSFFYENDKTLKAFAKTCIDSVVSTGVIMIMFMDGGSLKTLPFENKLVSIIVGKKPGEIVIDLLNESDPIFRKQREWLVDIDKLSEIFKESGFEIVENISMDDGANLPPLNLEFAKLNRMVVYKKAIEKIPAIDKVKMIEDMNIVNNVVGQDFAVGDKWIRHGVEWDNKSFVRAYAYTCFKKSTDDVVTILCQQLGEKCTGKEFAKLEGGKVKRRITYNLFGNGVSTKEGAEKKAFETYHQRCLDGTVGHEASALLNLIHPTRKIVIIDEEGMEMKRYGNGAKTSYIMKIGNYAYSPLSKASGYVHVQPVKPASAYGSVRSKLGPASVYGSAREEFAPIQENMWQAPDVEFEYDEFE